MLVAYAALKRRSSTVAPAVYGVLQLRLCMRSRLFQPKIYCLFFLSCIFFCRLRKQFLDRVSDDLDLLEFGGAGR